VQRISTDDGMQIEVNPKQHQNAWLSIRASLESGSNVTDEMEQLKKHSLQRTSTDAGTQIDFNDAQLENAWPSIRVSFESDSNVNEEMEEPDKH
jgi:hypothetical protein